ncbi:MFS transporter [Catellatospora methionotrophica]|uniref:MFS transporter n=1 Tax=Catellatospora methionotrophica TaxID=121620 RepID=A0A8J3LEE0_9ACTN|nr:MFS transporter [Catellatospora methionotrophica]GIG17722.1 MFS transporter [Catellatospora methionotrophica]
MRFVRESVAGLPRTFWMLFSAMLVNRVGAFGMLLLPIYLTTARGASVAVAGLVVGAYGAGGAGGTLLGGVLADRWGRKATYLAGTSVAALLMVGLGLARPIWLIATLAAAVGLAHSLPGPAVVAAIVDVLPEADRSRAFNLQFWAFNMGSAIAAALAGVIAEFSFLALFLIDAGMTAVTALLVWRLVPETLRRQRTATSPVGASTTAPAAPTAPAAGSGTGPAAPPGIDAGLSHRESGSQNRRDRPASIWRRLPINRTADRSADQVGLAVVLRDRVFLTFVGLTFVLALLTVQGQSILQLAMEGDGLRPSAYGLVVSLGGAMIVVGQLFVPKLIGARRHAVVLAAAFSLLAVGYSTVFLADRLWVYVAAASVWTVGQMLAAPPNASIIAELAPTALRGRYQGVFFLVFPAAGFVAPSVGGWSLQHLGPWHWLACGALGLLGAAGHLWTARRREARAASIRAVEMTPQATDEPAFA